MLGIEGWTKIVVVLACMEHSLVGDMQSEEKEYIYMRKSNKTYSSNKNYSRLGVQGKLHWRSDSLRSEWW